MAELGAGNGSGYPGAVDTDATVESASTAVRFAVPNDLAAAIIAVQTELGTNPAGSLSDVVTYLQTEHGADGTHDNTLVAMLAGTQTITGNKTLSGTTTLSGTVVHKVTAGITASTTQTQGQGALTSVINEVSVCANPNDTVTLPTAVAGIEVIVINNGAQTLRIFPASGDNLGAGLDTATTLVAGSNIHYVAYDTTNWESV